MSVALEFKLGRQSATKRVHAAGLEQLLPSTRCSYVS